MALSASTVLEVRTTGSDTNGGGFVTGASGTDWSQQDAAQYSVTDGVSAGTTTITSITANFGTDVVGNLMYVQGGTGSITAGWYQITARTNSTTITVDRSTGLTAGTGVTLKIGGALASPGMAGGVKATAGGTSGLDVFIKAGTYTVSVNTANVSNGKVDDASAGNGPSNPTIWEGYQTTRGDKGIRPIIAVDGVLTNLTIFTTSAGNYVVLDNFTVDGNSRATTTGISIFSTRTTKMRLKVQNTTVVGIEDGTSAQDASLYRCEATGCSGTAAFNIGTGAVNGCEAYNNTTTGFLINSGGGGAAWGVINCISSGNTGGSSNGFSGGGRNGMITGCISYGNGGNGFDSNFLGVMENCIAEGNTGAGFESSNGTNKELYLFNCAGYNNTGGNVSANVAGASANFVTGSSTFFVSGATGNFAPTGTQLKALGYPGVTPRGTTTGYRDIGIQHQDTGGASTTNIFVIDD
jgi:hypothetical protein